MARRRSERERYEPRNIARDPWGHAGRSLCGGIGGAKRRVSKARAVKDETLRRVIGPRDRADERIVYGRGRESAARRVYVTRG